MQVVEFQEVRKQFGDVPLFERFTWAVEQGRSATLLGENGSGKTTLLKMSANLVLPNSGDIRVCGYSVSNFGHHVRRHVAYLAADDRSFYSSLSGLHNLEFFGALQSLSASEIRDSARKLAARFGFEEQLDKPVQALSAGMRRRLSLIRCFSLTRPLYLLDEPWVHLDETTSLEVKKFILELEQRGASIILATADIHAIRVGKVYQLNRGVLVPQGEA